MCKNKNILICKENGHVWKCYRRDKQLTDEGTEIILFFECKICGIKFNTSDSDEKIYDEKDWEGLR